MTNTNTQGETVAKAVDGGTAPITPEMLAAGVLAYELIGISGGIVNTAEDHVALIYEAMREFSPSQHTGWSEEAVEAAARAMEPMAFREEYTATDEFFDLEQEGRAQAIGRARAALTAASSISPATGFEALKPDMMKALPGGTLDDSTYEQIENALDAVGAAICAADGRFMTLAERIRSSISPTVTAKGGEAVVSRGLIEEASDLLMLYGGKNPTWATLSLKLRQALPTPPDKDTQP